MRLRSFNTCWYPSMSNCKLDSLFSFGVKALNRLLLRKAIEKIAAIAIPKARTIEIAKSSLSKPGLTLLCGLITEEY